MTAATGRPGLPMTPTQRRVLEWLLAYPGVSVTANLSGSMVGWSHYWINERARQHMVSVMVHLGSDERGTAARSEPIPGPTPRITRPTFAVLNRNGWLRMVRHNRYQASYTISRAGILAVRGLSVEVAS